MRAELHDRIISAYGDLKTAAAEMGVPYKTLYRALTTKGKDRTATVTLDFIVEVITHLQEQFDGDDLAKVYASALARLRPSGEVIEGRFPNHNVPALDETPLLGVAKKKSRDPGGDEGGA